MRLAPNSIFLVQYVSNISVQGEDMKLLLKFTLGLGGILVRSHDLH